MSKFHIVAGVVILAVILVFAFSAFSTDVATDDWEMGTWGQSVSFELADGSVKSLQQWNPLSFFDPDSGQEVLSVFYNLYVAASGGGASTVDIDLSNYELYITVWDPPGYGDGTYYIWRNQIPVGMGSPGTVTVDADGETHDIYFVSISSNYIVPPDSIPTGVHQCVIQPKGELYYRTNGMGDWVEAVLPNPIIFDINTEQTPFSIVFSNGFEHNTMEVLK